MSEVNVKAIFQNAFHELEDAQTKIIHQAQSDLSGRVPAEFRKALLMRPMPDYHRGGATVAFGFAWPLTDAHCLIMHKSGTWTLEHADGGTKDLPSNWDLRDLALHVVQMSSEPHERMVSRFGAESVEVVKTGAE